MTLHEIYAEDIAIEDKRVERIMSAEEIFEAGFKAGQSLAGLRSDALHAYKDWLIGRIDLGE